MTDTMPETGTPTTTDEPTVDATTLAGLEAQFAHVTREEAIAAIIAATSCKLELANRYYDFLEEAVKQAHAYGEGQAEYEVFLYGDHFAFHPVMEVVHPDEVMTIRGSGTAADLTERAIFGSDAATKGFVHSKGGPQAVDCLTKVVVRRPSS